MKKKLFLLVIMCFSFLLLLGCKPKWEIKRDLAKVEERVLQVYQEAYPEDEFYFLSGPVYDKEYSRTNIRYRGEISSRKLEELGYYNGVGVVLENVDSPINIRNYRSTLEYLDLFIPLKNEAKKVFGDNLIFEINGSYTSAMHENIQNRMGTNMSRDKKTGLGVVVFTMFVDDLEKDVMEKQEEWKEKMLAIGTRYWQHYNVTASLQLNIFDRELLYKGNLAEASLGGIRNTDKTLREYLDRIKAGERLEVEEEAYVLDRIGNAYNFISVSYDYFRYENVRSLRLGTDIISSEEELLLENIEVRTFEAFWKNKEEK